MPDPVSASGLDIAAFRHQARALPLRALDDLETSPKTASDYFFAVCRDLIENGWQRWGHSIPSLRPPVPWNGRRGSFDYALHAWEPLTYLLRAYDFTSELEYFEIALDFARDWIAAQQRAFEGDNARAIELILSGSQQAAWYDMAVGQRIYRLAYILDVAARDSRHSDAVVAELAYALQFHHELLAADRFFAAHSNHGIYQALGQLAAARRFQWFGPYERFLDLARERVNRLLTEHFFPSGPHKEHSPGYHYMVLGSFIGAVASGVVDDAEALPRIRHAEEALSWMIQPDGQLTTFGDSDPRQLSRAGSTAARFRYSPLRWQGSQGKFGEPPPWGVRAFMDAGYAFARMGLPGDDPSDAAYLAQIAGFHSRVHKHADHLSFVWSDAGGPIMIDPGRYAYGPRTARGSDLYRCGFWYSDPKRVYMESTRAHNAVEIDRRSYPRAGVIPFGSALIYAGEQRGMAVTVCEVTHLRRVRHRRLLVLRPHHFLLVVDWLNDRTSEHDYRQWFHVHPSWTLRRTEGLVTGVRDTAAGRQLLAVTSVIDGTHLSEVVAGQDEPELAGWMSDKAASLVPAPAFTVESGRSARARFATLIVLGGPPSMLPSTAWNASMRNGRVAWRDERGEHHLTLATGENGLVQLELDSRRRSDQSDLGAR